MTDDIAEPVVAPSNVHPNKRGIMTCSAEESVAQLADVDISEMSREELIAHNLRVVEAHFHNENPTDIDKALALYTDDVSWEGPFRGQVYKDPQTVKEAYLAIFRTINFNRATPLRRFATERYVFDDQVIDCTVVGDEMPNLGFKVGDRISLRLVHCFEMRDGKIAREVAYEMTRAFKGPRDVDDIPENSPAINFPGGPHFGQW